MPRLLIVLAACSWVLSAAQAQEFPSVYVFGEEDGEKQRDCQVRYASSVAAVESELRQNQILIATSSQSVSEPPLSVYLNVNPLEITDGRCAVSYQLQMYHIQEIFHTFKEEVRPAIVEACSKGGLMTGESYGLQSRLNDAFRDFTNMCISEYLKK